MTPGKGTDESSSISFSSCTRDFNEIRSIISYFEFQTQGPIFPMMMKFDEILAIQEHCSFIDGLIRM